jgi:hypothetical protein
MSQAEARVEELARQSMSRPICIRTGDACPGASIQLRIRIEKEDMFISGILKHVVYIILGEMVSSLISGIIIRIIGEIYNREVQVK